MCNTDFRHLEFLSETDWGLSHLREFLYDPNLDLWRSLSPETFSDLYGAVKRRLQNDKQLANLLDLHLYTEVLIHKARAAPWFVNWVREHIRPDRFLPGIPWHMSLRGEWRAVPVLLAHERACLRYFILGRVSIPGETPLWPEWADLLMDESTKNEIMYALKACRSLCPAEGDRRFVAYPLAIGNRTVQVRGTSLGLPAALGFMALLTGGRIPGELAATGSVREDGSVGKAGRLSEKITHARNEGFRVFLFPADNHGSLEVRNMTPVPVDHLRQAWMFARLYEPGRAAELLLMGRMLKDPAVFVNNCHTVPLEWLLWARNNHMSGGTEKSISRMPMLFKSFVERVGASLEQGDLARGEELAKWVPPSLGENPVDAGSLSMFKWFTLNLSMANHRGDIPAAEGWREKAGAMVKNASLGDTESFAAFCNHRFIGLHHNRYDFSPEIPGFLKRILEFLEGQYRSQCRMLENATNETLGALYGSIAQNFGFCGPEYLVETRKYCRLSRGAYGNGNAPRLKEHWLRSLNYRIYAALDAGDPDGAENDLLPYVEMDDWRMLQSEMSRLSQWHHAAMARFFSAGKVRAEMEEYAEWAWDNKGRMVDERHPWQLWLYNMGRVSHILGDTKKARVFFSDSLELCLSTSLGPTVRVMGLLPLSGLRRISAVENNTMVSVEKRIRVSANNLNPGHFSLFLIAFKYLTPNPPQFNSPLHSVRIPGFSLQE